MNDFETIDSTYLEDVTGGALPIKPIIKGVEKGADNDARAQGQGVGSSLWEGTKAFVIGR
jgi:hypothetical protein